jgi:transketolase
MQNPTPERPQPARQMANAIRILAVDAVKKPSQATPARPWAWPTSPRCCGTATCKHNPANPHWADRDRFVLSNGHGSMLIYALLHLTGYDLPMDELKKFRQLHSKTAGHPEWHHARVWKPPPARWARASATRWAWRWPRSCWRPSSTARKTARDIVDHRTYVFLGDGCLMEGISHEACSLAGTLRLSKLMRSTTTTASASTAMWKAGSPTTRRQALCAYGWNVIGPWTATTPRRWTRAGAAKASRRRQAHADLLQDHRHGLAQQGRHARCARRRAGRRRGGRHARALGWTACAVRDSGRHAQRLERRAAAQARRGRLARALRPTARLPGEAAEFERRMAGDLPPGFADKAWTP